MHTFILYFLPLPFSGVPSRLPANHIRSNQAKYFCLFYYFKFIISLFLGLTVFAFEPINALTLFCLPFPGFIKLPKLRVSVTLNPNLDIFCLLLLLVSNPIWGSAGFIVPSPILLLLLLYIICVVSNLGSAILN